MTIVIIIIIIVIIYVSPEQSDYYFLEFNVITKNEQYLTDFELSKCKVTYKKPCFQKKEYGIYARNTQSTHLLVKVSFQCKIFFAPSSFY